jgi:ABC-2 type transport system ATP-binding protein
MTPAVRVDHVSRRYRGVTAVDEASFVLDEGRIHGLLGRNGAGKTTLMRLITGLDRPTSGTVEVFGSDPFEHDSVLRRTCFVKESQTYPDLSVGRVLTSARLLQPAWDEDLARSLVADFDLPLGRRVGKLSRGMRSALGIVVGLASRAPLTLFDEPYLGLDAPSRTLFYDRLLADFAEHPRTVVLSTHLIDEVANLLERVVVVDHGRVVIDAESEDVRGTAYTVMGPAGPVAQFVGRREVVARQAVGAYASATVRGRLDEPDRRLADELRLDLSPVSLQELVAHATTGDSHDTAPTEGGAR